ncbi:primase C-terminal domain-containing protein [Acetobacter cerevisiae]|nr:primase C-terminal domain-containing protein [Acetobacter cerevisiae]
MPETSIWAEDARPAGLPFRFSSDEEKAEIYSERLYNFDVDAPRALMERTPPWVPFSNNIKTVSNHVSTHYEPRPDALNQPWVSFDAEQWWNVLALDIDHSDWLDPWLSLPRCCRPHIVADPWSGRAAGLYVLRAPIFMHDLRQVKYGQHVQRLAAQVFGATPLPQRSLTKNPWGIRHLLDSPLQRRTAEPSSGVLWDAYSDSGTDLCWSTLTGTPTVSLHDLFDCDLFRRAADDLRREYVPHHPTERPEPSNLGRNCNLFDRLRFHAYDTGESNFEMLMREAERMNRGGLPESELRAIARSVSKFMTTRYRPADQKNRGVMGLENSTIPLPVKQRLAAGRTNSVRADNTDHKLRQAVEHWPAGRKLTQAALATAAQVSLKTVKRRWAALKSFR